MKTDWERDRILQVADRIHPLIVSHFIENFSEPKTIIVPRGLLPSSVESLWGVPVVREDEIVRYDGADRGNAGEETDPQPPK